MSSVPSPDAELDDIWRYALSLDPTGNSPTVNLDEITVLAGAMQDAWLRTGELPEVVVDLRRALYFQQRASRWADFGIPDDDERFVRAIVAKISDLHEGVE